MNNITPNTPVESMNNKEIVSEIRTRGRVCLVCERQFAKYNCPRCNIAYCSSSCYKNHDRDCTEKFWKENVEKELKISDVSLDEKKKMVEILQNIRELDENGIQYGETNERENPQENDKDSDNESEKEVKSLENIQKLQDLSPKQLERFQRALKEGKLSQYIQIWKPWWESNSKGYDNTCTRDLFIVMSRINIPEEAAPPISRDI